MKKRDIAGMFKPHIGKSVPKPAQQFEERDVIYCIVHTPLSGGLADEEYRGRIRTLFQVIDDSGGDVNQFCCGTTLALYGIPLDSADKLRGIHQLLVYLADKGGSVGAIAGETTAVYGAFGYEKRVVITALSNQMELDYRRVVHAAGRVMVHGSLIAKIGGLMGKVQAV